MAEPGDPLKPEDEAAPVRPTHDHDLDHLVGFASPASLAGRSHVQAPVSPAPVTPDLFDAPPTAIPPVLKTSPAAEASLRAPSAGVEPPSPPPADATPAWARETPRPAPAPASPVAAPSEGMMGLYSVYALILFAVPTLGVSALIGLLAVTGRATPTDPLARSHFIFQQRTLWAAAVIALLGAILVVVNIGVFVLFLLAVWTLVRGALGVLRLKSGRPLDNPRHWLI
jgi:uncharacterized membrane protein